MADSNTPEKIQQLGAGKARERIAGIINAARYGGTHTVLNWYQEPAAVVVPFDWWQKVTGWTAPAGTPAEDAAR